MGSAVDIRRHLSPPVGDDDLGYYVSLLSYRAGVSPDVPFWDLARSVRREIVRGLSRGEPYMVLDLFEGLFRALRGPSADVARFAPRWQKVAPPSTMTISNLGAQRWGDELQPLSVESLYVTGALSIMGDFGAVVTTFRDALFWTFVTAEPLIAPERARNLVRASVRRLLRAVEEER